MCHKKRLHKHAKQTNPHSYWDAYHKLRNLINKKLGKAHTEYQNHLFDNSFTGNRRQFWKYVRSRRKEKCGVPFLSAGGTHAVQRKKQTYLIIILNQF